MEAIINQHIAYALRQVEQANNDKSNRELWAVRLEKLLTWRDNYRAIQCQ